MKIGLQKRDIILIILVIVIAAVFYLAHEWQSNADNGQITVTVNGEIQGIYPLDQDQTIQINQGTNILEIKDGEANMTEADCPDKLCVHQRAISKYHESIICLPNKVVVEVTEGGEREFDAIVNEEE